MFSWIQHEWVHIFKNPKLMVALIVILFVPILYSGTYLWANWDPYAHLERLPVAVVNEDEKVEYNGTTYKIGDDLVKELKTDKSFKWQFVRKKDADRGLKNNQFYFEIYIPRDFSKRATTLTAQKPTPLNLYYKVNVGSNFIASQIGRTSVDKIRAKLSQQLSKNYAEVIFDNIKLVGEGMAKASKGSSKITEGLNKLTTGTGEIISGMQKQVEPLRQLSSGAQKLSAAAAQLSNGAAKIQSGMTQVNNGLSSLEGGLRQLNSNADQFASAIATLTNGSKQLRQVMEGYENSHPGVANDSAYQQMIQISHSLNGGQEKLNSNFSSFNQGLNKASQSSGTLSAGSAAITTKMQDLSNGAQQLATSQAKISSGATDVYNGWNSVIGHLQTLKNGEVDLASGSKELTDKLAAGAKQIQDIRSGQPIYEMMSNPVRLKEELVHSVPNYGTGLAPYFLSLSLFVGALLLSTILPLRATSSRPPSALAWFLSKWVLLAFVSIFHSVITNLFLINLIGLEPVNQGYLYLFTFLSSLMFMSIILLLVIALDNAGRFLAIVLLVLQLTSSAGTFPIELTPKFLQTMHSLLPMSYTVQGFRAIISTGDDQILRSDVTALVIYLVAAVILTLLVIRVLLKKGTRAEEA
ncbi:YhgE/Pip domain-containing protein [Neobacillus pocheonensis]|uniref:YhgE/Pip family protein n=1 Tax=Neobacillus pocheonensis TaxID=363869 RepID=UPI003D27B2FE